MSVRDRQLGRAGVEKPEQVDLPAAVRRRSSYEVVQTGRLKVKVSSGTRIEIHFERTLENATDDLTAADAAGTYYVWRKYTYGGTWSDWAISTAPDPESPTYRVFLQAVVTIENVGGTNRITNIEPQRTGNLEVYRRETC